MSQKPKIQDPGEKLGGARKDLSQPLGPRKDGTGQEALLEVLWPKSEKWTDLIPELGVHRAALSMVVYETCQRMANVVRAFKAEFGPGRQGPQAHPSTGSKT